ncbi:hypothetical protein [Terrisporobacter sp.]|uniref:hypothetical protein n=1 Tax=Terrisporobacter sp. TaxID=1965305 RepID=UPI00289AF8B0|nr:hypothetical protein [Terrisporobacter sp.]
MSLIKIFKRLFCKHKNQYTVTNFYGDAINYFNCRSWRECEDCGKIIEGGLDKNCDRVNQWWYIK